MLVPSARTAKATLCGIGLATALLTAGTLGSERAHAQSTCDVRKTLVAKLDTGYGEQPIAVGLASTGHVVEVLISVNGSWTILITRPDGVACIAAVGEDWEMLATRLADESS